jgi:hypothetical protein
MRHAVLRAALSSSKAARVMAAPDTAMPLAVPVPPSAPLEQPSSRAGVVECALSLSQPHKLLSPPSSTLTDPLAVTDCHSYRQALRDMDQVSDELSEVVKRSGSTNLTALVAQTLGELSLHHAEQEDERPDEPPEQSSW